MNLLEMSKVLKYLNKKGILGSLYPIPQFNDEPHFHQWACENIFDKNSENNGVSIDTQAHLAKFKAIAEAIERYCSMCPDESVLVHGKYSSMDNCADPVLFSTSVPNKKKSNNLRNSTLSWVPSIDVSNGKEILVPSQSVYTRFVSREPFYTIPISTGCALGFDRDSASKRGLEEVIERDGFMRGWNFSDGIMEITPPVENNELIDYFKRYHLGVKLFELNPLKILSTYMAIITDQTGVGPAVSCGLSSGKGLVAGTKKAILEAQQARSWIRLLSARGEHQEIKTKKEIVDFQSRGFYWYPRERISDLDFLNNLQTACLDGKVCSSEKEIIDYLIQEGHSVYLVDITTKTIQEMGMRVMKYIIPTLFPLRISERQEYNPLALSDFSKKLNTIPHPFL